MGKDADNTLFAENQVAEQRLDSNISGQFKGEPLTQAEQPSGGFHGDKWHEHNGDQLKSAQPLQMKQESAGGFHGDKLLEGSATEQYSARRPSLTNSMGDEFPADHFKKEQGMRFDNQFKTETILRPEIRSALPAQTTATFSAGIVEPRVHASDAAVKGDIIKNDTREAKHEVLAELKSHSTHGDHIVPSEIHEGTTIHDGRLHGGMLEDGRTIAPQALPHALPEQSLGATTIHDGRIHDTAPITETNRLSLAERVVAGVHAGDPLSSGKPLKDAGKKKDKKDKKDKKLKKEKGAFGADEHLRSDKDLIPHEHLKKESGSILADANLSGGAVLHNEEHFRAEQPIIQHEQPLKSSLKKDKKDKKDKKKHFDNDAHLNKNVNIVDSMSLHDSEFADSQFNKGLTRDQDAFLATDNHHLSRDANFASEGSGKQSLKDKAHSTKEMIKDKLGMNKEEHFKSTHSEGSAPVKGHEIATIKIPGIESGDRAAQEMVNHQAKAKKELNAELKEHAGHTDHFAPSELIGHGMEHMSLHENRAVDSQPLSNRGNALSDQITRDQVLAKSELNAEIKNHAGSTLMPSEILDNQNKDFHSSQLDNNLSNQNQSKNKDLFKEGQSQNKDMFSNDLLHSNQLQSKDFVGSEFQHNSKQLEGNRLADFGATSDAMKKDNILAKKDLNAEIQSLGQDHIMPSDISHKSDFQSKDFQSKDFQSKEYDSDVLSAKKELLAEIKETGNIHPSELHHKEQNFENTAEFQNKQFEKHNEYLDDKAGALGAMFKDEVMREHIQLKKELNAELKEVAMEHPGHLLPSEVSGTSPEGIVAIHDGREKGSDRLKSEMDYEMAKGSIEASVAAENQPMSFTQKLAATVANVTSVATSVAASAAVAVKESLQNRLHKKDEAEIEADADVDADEAEGDEE